MFVGKVVSSNAPKSRAEFKEEDIIFDIEVVENFKGAEHKRMRLNRGSMGSSCYGGYTIGETYLFYASSREDGGYFEGSVKGEDVVYQGSFCSRTSNIESAQDQIYFIREMLAGKAEPQIYGSVGRSDTDPVSFDWRYQYLSGIKVVLKGEKRQFVATTDKNGIFKFNNIPEGKYVLSTNPPNTYKTYFPEEEGFEVLPENLILAHRNYGMPQKGFYAEFRLSWNNEIKGNILDSQGIPLRKCVLRLLPLAKADAVMTPYYDPTSPDHQRDGGSFIFGGETPGKYVMAVEIYTPSANGLRKRFFYPQAETAAKAQVFEFAATTSLENIRFKVPLTARAIKGTIFWSDGTPVKDKASLRLTKFEAQDAEDNTHYDWGSSEKDSTFSLQGFDGFEYFVQINVVYYDKRNERKDVFIKPVKVSASAKLEDLKITVEKPSDFGCEDYNGCKQK